MKKTLIFVMMLAVASVFTSCEDSNKKLVESLKGTWEGTSDLGPIDYQFFESTDGTTGHFVEVTYITDSDVIGDKEYTIKYYAFVCGEYAVQDGWLSLTYLPETTYIEMFDEDAFWEYVTDIYNAETADNSSLWESQEDLADYLIYFLEDNWSEACEEQNNSMGNGFSNLTITEDKMSFVASDGTMEFTRNNEDWFTSYPFAD